MSQTEWEKKKWEEEASTTGIEAQPAPVTDHRKTIILTVSAVLISAALIWFFLIRHPRPPAAVLTDTATQQVEENLSLPDETSAVEKPAGELQTIEPATVPLADSDLPVREQAIRLSSHQKLAAIIAEGDLIRRFVAGTQAIAMGESPAKLFEPLAPKGPYLTLTLDGRLTVDPRSHKRYDALIGLLLSLDPEQSAELYIRFEPQIEAASRELGNPEAGPFIGILQKAVNQLQQTPLPPDRPELVEKTLSYAYADPALEQLNAAQKHFLRLGSNHLRQLKGKMTLMLETLMKHKKM